MSFDDFMLLAVVLVFGVAMVYVLVLGAVDKSEGDSDEGVEEISVGEILHRQVPGKPDSSSSARRGVTPSGDPNVVAPAVLEQALGSVLQDDEPVVCALFAASCKGPILSCGVDDRVALELVVVTDRRLIKVVAWFRSEDALFFEGYTSAMLTWCHGGVLTRRSRLTRLCLWLGQVREVEVERDRTGKEKVLILHTADGGREKIAAGKKGIVLLDEAFREVLAGPGRDALPPPPPPPLPEGGWMKQIAAVFRPSGRTRTGPGTEG